MMFPGGFSKRWILWWYLVCRIFIKGNLGINICKRKRRQWDWAEGEVEPKWPIRVLLIWAKLFVEGRQWNCARGKCKPKWLIRVILNWAKAAEADILPGSVLGSVAPVQAALQLGPPLLPWRCIWEAFSRVLPQGRLEEPWMRAETSPVLATFQLCDLKTIPSKSPSSYWVSGSETTAPTDLCTALNSPPGFCPPHLTTPLQANNQAAAYIPGQCSSCVVWGPACVHELPVSGSWQGKYRVGENCSETLEQYGRVVLCVIIKKTRTFLVQWLRVCLPVRGMWVLFLVWEHSMCHRATKPVCCNCWALMPKAFAP